MIMAFYQLLKSYEFPSILTLLLCSLDILAVGLFLFNKVKFRTKKEASEERKGKKVCSACLDDFRGSRSTSSYHLNFNSADLSSMRTLTYLLKEMLKAVDLNDCNLILQFSVRQLKMK
ncbi:hypothetical protein ZIOFF_059056 [Zingiber officinale]|uniref:Uncharacterized protein n=1 Tax=Zingiber officinale TaxID=94328 RepID=A0A8J5F8X1_ZINOF|nr:hypothetical protein ZIOFF_059056 [Zingiber officinale]